MDPQTNQCGVCKSENVIGLSIFVWPETQFTHVCVNCAIDYFPSFLSMPRESVTLAEGLDFIREAYYSDKVRGNIADPEYFLRLMSEQKDLDVETK